MTTKRGRPKTPVGHLDDTAERIADALLAVIEIHRANVLHAREQLARTRTAFEAARGADLSLRRARQPELVPHDPAAERRQGERRAHLRAVGE